MPVLEIAGEHPARLFGRVDAVDIGQRLSLCLAEVEAARFLFDEQRARPEQVHETMFVAEQFDPLFIDGDRAALDAENVEEVVVKALRFALLDRKSTRLNSSH